MNAIQAVVFDWGDTLMRDLPQFEGAMVHWPRVERMPGVMETLGPLKGRAVLCVASNAGDSDAELMGRALERAGIRHYFDHLWTSSELGATKPSPAFFLAILRELELEPQGCVTVGNDYEKDIVPAKAAGMWTVWLAPLPAPKVPDADAVIHAMEELAPALLELGLVAEG
jgi:HAD superfamily hydrolase (TIGR01509 family)